MNTYAEVRGARNVLAAAFKAIENPRNWEKGSAGTYKQRPMDEGGGHYRTYCASVAVFACAAEVSGGGVRLSGAGTLAHSTLMEQAGGYPTIPFFNDDASTTHSDVLALFNRAIDVLDKRLLQMQGDEILEEIKAGCGPARNPMPAHVPAKQPEPVVAPAPIAPVESTPTPSLVPDMAPVFPEPSPVTETEPAHADLVGV